jgi:hypothetical protein
MVTQCTYMESTNEIGNEIATQLVKPLARDDAYWLTIGDPETIPPVEVLDIKWKELYDKWGKFIPQEKKLEW